MEKAKRILEDGNFTCVLCKADAVITSKDRGVKPLLELVEKNICVKDFCAADKVVGKAAAFLYVILNVSAVHANVLSRPALAVFEKHNIQITYDTLCDYIENRQKNGKCPMESAVLDIDDKETALRAIKDKLEELKK